MKTSFMGESETIKSLRADWLAKHVDAELHELRYHKAETRADREAAYSLLYRVYLSQGYIRSNPSKLHLNAHLLLPNTWTFVAMLGKRAVGTVSIVVDSPMRLPIDSLFPQEMNALRATRPGYRIGEFTAFVVDPDYRDSNVSLKLITLAYKLGYIADLDSFVMEVSRDHAKFHGRVWGAKPFASGKVFPVDRTPAVALHLDIDSAYARFRAACHNLDVSRSLLHVGRWELPLIFSSPTTVSTAQLDYFLTRRTTAWDDMTPCQQEKFGQVSRTLGRRVPERFVDGEGRRWGARFPYAADILIDRFRHAALVDLGVGGFRFVATSGLRKRDHFFFGFYSRQMEFINGLARCVWIGPENESNNRYGAEIVEMDLHEARSYHRLLSGLHRISDLDSPSRPRPSLLVLQ